MAVFVVRKKAGDRFVDKSSRVQKWQMFSESDRRGLVKVENDDGRLRLRCTHGVSDMRSP